MPAYPCCPQLVDCAVCLGGDTDNAPASISAVIAGLTGVAYPHPPPDTFCGGCDDSFNDTFVCDAFEDVHSFCKWTLDLTGHECYGADNCSAEELIVFLTPVGVGSADLQVTAQLQNTTAVMAWGKTFADTNCLEVDGLQLDYSSNTGYSIDGTASTVTVTGSNI